jgi:hypothetical protein
LIVISIFFPNPYLGRTLIDELMPLERKAPLSWRKCLNSNKNNCK